MEDTKPLEEGEYSNVEYLAMVRLYALANDNLSKTRKLYAEPAHLERLRAHGVPEPKVPSSRTILETMQRLQDVGSFRAPPPTPHPPRSVD